MKIFKIFVLVFSLFAIRYPLYADFANAQVPPNNPPVKCYETGDPEFHSLRPYQASPCSSEVLPYASFCGNKLTLKEIVPATYPGGGGVCKQEGGKIVCKFNISVLAHKVTIDLKGANLPIMGNTEDVINSTNPIDPENSNNNMPPEQRVNDYVSWYLNGIFGRAEYSFPPINTTVDAPSIPDFSGPINKLLPQEVQQQKRAETVKNAKVSRHDQIVGCTFGINTLIPIPGWDQLFGFPIPCYIKGLSGIASFISIRERRLSDWKNHIPPVRSDFDNYTKYYKKYQEWRGKKCFSVTIPNFIPVVGGMTILLCGEDPLRPNFYSNLYQYIPFSSTEDLEGNIKIDSFSSASGDSVKNITFNNQTPSTLFFSHLEESDQLGSILQDTYISKDQQEDEKTGPDVAVEPSSSCTTVDVRSNKGDSLFTKSLSGDLGYTTSFTCSFNPPSCKTSSLASGGEMCKSGPGGKCTCTNSAPLSRKCPSGYTCGQKCSCEEPIQTCNKTVYIALSTTSNTPKIDDVWSRLVAGPTAIVKRIFPKLGTQIGTLKDMPGSTGITYSGSGVQSSGELNLPHVGGISEYFLKGIQTMLRPKGYGENISFAETASGTSSERCASNAGDVDEAISDAASEYGVPAGLLKAIFQIEGVEYIANPSSYVCEENTAGAAGVMQITPGAYDLVTCESERMTDNLAACSEPGKLSRCVIHDAFELAARVLLSRVGYWSTDACRPYGSFPSNKQDIYNAACRYYGRFSPDVLTIHAAQQFGLPDPNNKNYCDVICFLMGSCPPFPGH